MDIATAIARAATATHPSPAFQSLPSSSPPAAAAAAAIPLPSSQPIKKMRKNPNGISLSSWNTLLASQTISKPQLHRIIMQHLVMEGHQDVAEAFQRETGVESSIPLASISSRMSIRSLIQQGDITNAIIQLNEYNPDILDNNETLYFHLQCQKLIEMIRENEIDRALSFAREELGPRAKQHPEFLLEMEQIMSLLAFPPSSLTLIPPATGGPPPHIAALISAQQRINVASEANDAILALQCQNKESSLSLLLKRLIYHQDQLDTLIEFPLIPSSAFINPHTILHATTTTSTSTSQPSVSQKIDEDERMS